MTILDEPRFFRSVTGAIEFVKFEGRLHALDALDAAQSAAVHGELLELDREIERISREAESDAAGDTTITVDAALDDWLFDARAWVSDDWLFFTRASNVAFLLTLLETLLDDLVEVAEMQTGSEERASSPKENCQSSTATFSFLLEDAKWWSPSQRLIVANSTTFVPLETTLFTHLERKYLIRCRLDSQRW